MDEQSNLESEVQSLREEIKDLRNKEHSASLGAFQGIGAGLLTWLIGFPLVAMLNWLCVWLIYFWISWIHARWIYDLRAVTYLIAVIGGCFFGLPSMVYGWIGKNKSTKKTSSRKIAFTICSIVAFLLWGYVFVTQVIRYPW